MSTCTDWTMCEPLPRVHTAGKGLAWGRTEMSCAVKTVHDAPTPVDLIIGVGDAQRLRGVAAAELRGHRDDADLDAIVRTLHLACGVPIAAINIVTSNLQTYTAEVGVGEPCTEILDGLSFCAEVVNTGLSLIVPDAAGHPVYSRNPMVLDGVVGAYAGLPLVVNGVVLGTVAIFDRSAREFSAEVLEILGHQTQLATSTLSLRRQARTDVLTGLQALTEEWGIDGQRLDVDISIGCALTASPTTPPTMLLHDADKAMYEAKKLPGTRSVLPVRHPGGPTRRHPA